MTPLLETNLPLPLHARGKVRDLYTVGDDLLFVATDRISAFDHVLASGIPDKGRVLTQLSLFWFEYLRQIIPNHLLTAKIQDFPGDLAAQTRQLAGRSMLVRRAKMFPVECVVRGYLSGSAWAEYKSYTAVCGIPLPPNLRESDRLPEPIFTPAAKNNIGHDENISYPRMAELIGEEHAAALKDLSLRIYAAAAKHAESRGLILADTKFEFGLIDGVITLADEALTPDSSRYWSVAEYAAALKAGRPQPSFDKQFVRDYLESIHWNKQAPAPALTEDVIARTRAKYLEAYRLITGRNLSHSGSRARAKVNAAVKK
jgi:phosphoribosylaminoimidazole-succinocarboxamide synthase